MQRLIYSRFAIVAILLLSASVLWAADPVMHAPNSAVSGSVLQVAITGEELSEITLALVDDRDRTLSRSEGFQWRTPTGRSAYAILLGIPSTAPSGRYTLVLSAVEGRAEWRHEQSLTIFEPDFPEQVITMNGKMSALFNDESERKKAESRELWAVLTAFDTSAIFHLGPFLDPLPGGVPTAGFGDRRRYRMPDGSESSSVHFGADLWAETGTAIRASGRGRVALATERFLTGNTVVLEHLPGIYTLYYHMDSLMVRPGQMIEQGDDIGTVGQTGFATGEHLHWEMRVTGTPVDPRNFLESPLLDTNELMSKM